MRPGDPAGNRPSPASAPQPAGPAPAIGEHTLKIEAARAGVTAQEYLTRLSQGLLYCYRCQDWHPEDAFPADNRRHSGRAGSCNRAIRAAVRQDLAGRGQLPPPAAVWVIKRLDPSPGPGGQACTYWRGPGPAPDQGRKRPGTWSPALDENTARFPGAGQARDALITAHGGPGAVPAGCRLVRLA
jgi:hypothetical protein